ncbi:hypothetical protein D3C78_636880 [compost metagenome]
MCCDHHQFLHLCRLPFAEIAGSPVGATAIAQQDDTASVVLLGVGHSGIETGKDALGIGFVIDAWGLGLGCTFAGFTLGGRGFFDAGIGVVRRVLGRCALTLGHRLAWSRCSFDACLRAVGQQVRQAQAQAMPAGVRKLAAQRADGLWPVGGFASTGEDDQCALGFAGVGRFPQREEVVAAGLQHLLLGLGNLPLQRQGIFLAAFSQRLALDACRWRVFSSLRCFICSRLCATR